MLMPFTMIKNPHPVLSDYSFIRLAAISTLYRPARLQSPFRAGPAQIHLELVDSPASAESVQALSAAVLPAAALSSRSPTGFSGITH
jgi:hypothetical protein